MLKLIKLEMKKYKLQKYIKGAVIAHLILIALILFLQVIFKIEKESAFESLEGSLMLIDSAGRITFSMFASVMLSKLIISEYSNKTIRLMFMYPVSRKKVFLSKLIIVSGFTFINIIISYILLTLTLFIASSMTDLLSFTLTIDNIMNIIPSILINSALAAGTALIPLYFGMRKKSVPTTIISAFLVVALMYSNNGGQLTLSSILPVTIAVAVIGLLVGVGTLNKLDYEDVI